jgi:DNA replication protein DnaC
MNMDIKKHIHHLCGQFKMKGLTLELDALIKRAEAEGLGYLEFTRVLLQSEADHRERRALVGRLKDARLPRSHELSRYDHSVENALTKTRLNQLRELNWLDQIYNIILMGPSGTGKTHLAAGLCFEAATKGYKAYFRTMEELTSMLKTKEFARSAKAEYRRLLKADLIVTKVTSCCSR